MMVFFFQAEDGIRDGHVTGVQTCALPISFGFNVRNSPFGAPYSGKSILGSAIASAYNGSLSLDSAAAVIALIQADCAFLSAASPSCVMTPLDPIVACGVI